MSKIKHEEIRITKITKSVWIAETKTLHPLKAEIEMRGNCEQNSFEKLMKFFESDAKPTRIEELENGNKIYHF